MSDAYPMFIELTITRVPSVFFVLGTYINNGLISKMVLTAFLRSMGCRNGQLFGKMKAKDFID